MFHNIILTIMKNFQKFEKAYVALKDAKQAAVSFSTQKVIECYARDFQAFKQGICSKIDIAMSEQLDWFDEHFPQDTFDAAHSNCFSYPEFFSMLKNNPELVESNEKQLENLLCSLKARGLYGTGLESVPAIEEFVTPELQLKKTKVANALAELQKVSDEKLKQDLAPIVADLSLRRPKRKKAYYELLIMYNNLDKETTGYEYVRSAKEHLI